MASVQRSKHLVDIDRGWAAIMTAVQKEGAGVARVGILEGAVSASGAAPGLPAAQQTGDSREPTKTVPGVSLARIAAINEFGTERIPARPFMRRTFDENRAKYERMLQIGAGEIAAGRMTVRAVLTQLALANQKDVRETITKASQWAEPNAPATIERKGSSAPLIDTGAMRNAVAWEVEIGKIGVKGRFLKGGGK